MSDEQHGGPSGKETSEEETSGKETSEEGTTSEEETTSEEGAPERGLSELDLAVLALERRAFSGPGAKERAVRERLGMTPTRYYQLLGALLDDPRALAHDPVTVNRLRRIRDARRERR
ncbi:DUF3263 domain-containing protein [Streptomyces sp. URMC 127]|uniref:DUF3263 domain-containing protein n=1 Tax=Streptomyces sp. URMC 127 TaxID=3423402 RepID=UPI003F1AD30D